MCGDKRSLQLFFRLCCLATQSERHTHTHTHARFAFANLRERLSPSQEREEEEREEEEKEKGGKSGCTGVRRMSNGRTGNTNSTHTLSHTCD